jgi:hypothetical protein
MSHASARSRRLSATAASAEMNGARPTRQCVFRSRSSAITHIPRALVEAAKLAPRQNHEMAVIYDQERQKGNSNRATLTVARKMVAYLLALDRQQRDFVPAEERRISAA